MHHVIYLELIGTPRPDNDGGAVQWPCFLSMNLDADNIWTRWERVFHATNVLYTEVPQPARLVLVTVEVSRLVLIRAMAKIAAKCGFKQLSEFIYGFVGSNERRSIPWWASLLFTSKTRGRLVQPWFYLESFEDGHLISRHPHNKAGFSTQVFECGQTLMFEFLSARQNPIALKFPISSSVPARARVSFYEKGEGMRHFLGSSEYGIPYNTPDGVLRVDLNQLDPTETTDKPSWLSLFKLMDRSERRNHGCQSDLRRIEVSLMTWPIQTNGFINLLCAQDSQLGVLDASDLGIIPSVSIVTLLYKKEQEIPEFVQSICGQDFPGAVEVIAVEDSSPDQSLEVFSQSIDAGSSLRPASFQPVVWRLHRNNGNLGNCASRNIGMSQANGDIVFVMDCDCIPNRAFLTEHVFAHAIQNVDVVVGPYNIETGSSSAKLKIAELERDVNLILSHAEVQDPINYHGFLNCITRNLSFKRTWLDRVRFDEDFGYSRNPESGFGWEDIDLGVQFYRQGARIFCNPHAFTVHISHPPNSEPSKLPVRSERNFARLLSKHPDLELVARRWVLFTHSRLENWLAAHHCEPTEKTVQLRERLTKPELPRFSIKKQRPLRLLTYRWHPSHQYEIYKLGHRFDLARSKDIPLTGFTEQWDYNYRALPASAAFVELDKVDFRAYDAALLHFDENVLDWQNTNGVLSENWGASFRYFMENIPLPKVAVCHGTVQFRGMYHSFYDGPDLCHEIEESRERLVDFLDDTLIICNSHQAEKEWRFKNSRVIWQGFDPTEFPEATREKGILTLGRSMKERPYYRGYYFFKEATKSLSADQQPVGLLVDEPSFPHVRKGNEYAQCRFRAYVDAIRQYSIYFNPTLRSPMPRSRGEAMMCGLVTVSARNHDVDMFIENGVNGFSAEEPQEATEQMQFLLSNRPAMIRMGKASRQTAIDIFNHDRFLAQWNSVLEDVIG
jgi:glycosyltransferase involved in cell wall biosynthesis